MTDLEKKTFDKVNETIEEAGFIEDLLIDFDEMGFAPTTLCPNPEAYAIEWKRKLIEELKGYRKASDVVRDIFNDLNEMWHKGRGFIKYSDLVRLERLHEQKYTEGEE